MKAIRLLAAIMFLTTGVLHLYIAIKDPSDPNFILTLVCGIVYLATSVLLIMEKKFAVWLGFIIALIPLVVAPFMIDFNNPEWTMVVLLIELIAAICCLILLIKKSKG